MWKTTENMRTTEVYLSMLGDKKNICFVNEICNFEFIWDM